MKKNIIVYIIIIILIALIGFGAYKLITVTSTKNIENEEIENKEVCLNIVKDENRTGELNIDITGEGTKYYYFDVVNYDVDETKYNELEVTPYLKVELGDDSENSHLKYKLFHINNLEDEEANWTEITEKGENGSSFEDYYKGETVFPYNYDDLDKNSSHYVLKLIVDGAEEDLAEIEEDVIENFSIVLGYKENK